MSSVKLKTTFKTLLHYKSFLAGVVILLFFIGLSIYAMITWPYDQAIAMWNDPSYWQEYPTSAPPEWIQIFTGKKEIVNKIVIDSRNLSPRYISRKTESTLGYRWETVNITINYDYDVFPTSGTLYLIPVLKENTTLRNIGIRNVTLIKPNGVVLKLFDGFVSPSGTTVSFYRKPGETHPLIDQFKKILRSRYNTNLTTDINAIEPIWILFMNEKAFIESNQKEFLPLKGTYILSYVYDKPPDLDSVEIKLVLRGTVYGLLGTDNVGRDLFMGIAWGAPIALLFGLLASVLTTFLTMVIAAIVAWFRGAVDEAVSRVNEIFMIIPFLPLLIMIMIFYGFTLWTLLLIVVALNIIGSGGIKTYRAMFLQIRESPYIEAAKAYGAGSWRIIFRYMVPKIMPVLIPSIVLSVPSFVFLEAALALLGLSDPRIISWGKILEDAIGKAALFAGWYHWILAPSIALMLLSFAFAFIGFTLDKVFNPRLRQV